MYKISEGMRPFRESKSNSNKQKAGYWTLNKYTYLTAHSLNTEHHCINCSGSIDQEWNLYISTFPLWFYDVVIQILFCFGGMFSRSLAYSKYGRRPSTRAPHRDQTTANQQTERQTDIRQLAQGLFAPDELKSCIFSTQLASIMFN